MYNDDPNAFLMSIDTNGGLHIPKFARKLRNIKSTDKLIIRFNDSLDKFSVDLNTIIKKSSKNTNFDTKRGNNNEA